MIGDQNDKWCKTANDCKKKLVRVSYKGGYKVYTYIILCTTI